MSAERRFAFIRALSDELGKDADQELTALADRILTRLFLAGFIIVKVNDDLE